MKTHVQVIAILHLIFCSLGLLLGLIIGLLTIGGGILSQEKVAMMITSGVGMFFVIFFALISIPGIVGAIGVLKYKNWGRILLIIVGVFNLPGFPVGTALGIYTIWGLLHKDTLPLFEKNQVRPS